MSRPFVTHLLEGDIMVERRHTERSRHSRDGSEDRGCGGCVQLPALISATPAAVAVLS